VNIPGTFIHVHTGGAVGIEVQSRTTARLVLNSVAQSPPTHLLAENRLASRSAIAVEASRKFTMYSWDAVHYILVVFLELVQSTYNATSAYYGAPSPPIHLLAETAVDYPSLNPTRIFTMLIRTFIHVHTGGLLELGQSHNCATFVCYVAQSHCASFSRKPLGVARVVADETTRMFTALTRPSFTSTYRWCWN
jgi:hypothetical protein